MKIRAKNILVIIATLAVFAMAMLGLWSQSYKSDLADSFQKAIGITDINSSLQAELISIKRREGYLDPEIIVHVENFSGGKLSFSPDASVTVSTFIIADGKWIKTLNNNDVFFLNDGKEITLYPDGTSQRSDIRISVYPVLSYPTGYNTEGMKVENIVRILVVGELVRDEGKSRVGAYVDAPFR